MQSLACSAVYYTQCCMSQRSRVAKLNIINYKNARIRMYALIAFENVRGDCEPSLLSWFSAL